MTDHAAQDFADFERLLRQDGPGLFATGGGPIFIARAPGRLDVMGGMTDYSGGLVVLFPIGPAALVAAQRDDTGGGAVRVRSANAPDADLAPEVTLPADAFVNPTALLKLLREGPAEARWAGYVAGSLALLRAEGLVPRGAGARFFLHSSVPMRAGLASSAAVAVASLRALCAAFGVEMDALLLARLCQRVENDVMDVPGGITEPVGSALGEEGRLLRLLCQPYQIQGALPMPAGWSVFGIDSGVRASDDGSAYRRARVAAFMGYKMLADRAGSGFGGYLCNVSPDEYRGLYPNRLPETLSGAVFLGAHGGIFDTATTVEPGEAYPVRAGTEHAIFEMERVRRFLESLEAGGEAAVHGAGEQMTASHASYTACGLGAPETDLLVDLARARGAEVAGARVTGAGGGGTVAVLVRADAEEATAQSIAGEYERRTGNRPRLIRGTSPGAFGTEVRELTLSTPG